MEEYLNLSKDKDKNDMVERISDATLERTCGNESQSIVDENTSNSMILYGEQDYYGEGNANESRSLKEIDHGNNKMKRILNDKRKYKDVRRRSNSNSGIIKRYYN